MTKLKRPDLHFATEKFIPRGNALYMEKTELHPRYFACHPDDLEQASGLLEKHFTLVSLPDHEPSDEQLYEAAKHLARRVEEMLTNKIDDAFGINAE